MFYSIALFVFVIVCLLLIVIILLQSSQSGGMGSIKEGNELAVEYRVRMDDGEWVGWTPDNAFTFEYSFRLSNDQDQISHLYPYVNDKVVSLKLCNFDWDDDGYIKVVSVARRGDFAKTSKENEWVNSTHIVSESEKSTSLDVQFIKNKSELVRNNNVVIYITNQYGEFLPFYTAPIGGIPKFKYSIGVQKK